MKQELKFNSLWEDKGAAMLEYTLMAALIAVAAFLAITEVGTYISDTFNLIGDTLSDAMDRIQA